MIWFFGAAYISIGFFLAGLYVGFVGNVSIWDKASIALFWGPGIFYVIGYRLGRASKT